MTRHTTRRTIAAAFALTLAAQATGGWRGDDGIEEAVGDFRPASMAYVLQADALAPDHAAAVAALALCDRDLIVIDTDYEPGDPWTAGDVNTIRAARPGRRVVAYLSIGEAEDYRAYWDDAWTPGAPGTPTWLLAENPDWAGNYKVEYWRVGWQSIILDRVDAVLAAGFDGVYLDIVDAFEWFEQDGRRFIDDRENPATAQTYRRDMIDWVLTIATYARGFDADFIVIPQNGPQLLEHADYLAGVDVVAVEDLVTRGNQKANKKDQRYRMSYLDLALDAGRTVIAVEYPTKPKKIRQALDALARLGIVAVMTDRELTGEGLFDE